MMRVRAVATLLADDVAGVRWSDEPDGDELDEMCHELDRAARRALFMVGLSWAALALLLFTHEDPSRFLGLDGQEIVFTVGALVVAVFSGFRLGQWGKYRTVRRLVTELADRAGG